MARDLIVLLAVVLVLGGLFFVLRPDAPAAGPRDRAFDLSIEGGEMSPDEISAREGDRVTLDLRSDKPMELHLHGYDVERDIEPGETARASFEADLTGRFEIEDHGSERELGVLQVRPR